MQQIILVEDETASRFFPLTYLRPVFELLCGHFSVRERVQELSPHARLGAILRPELAQVYQEEHPEIGVQSADEPASPGTLYINGRWLFDRVSFTAAVQLKAGTVAMNGGSWVAARLADAPRVSLSETIAHGAQISIGGQLLSYPWQLIEQNANQLTIDFNLRTRTAGQTIHDPRIAILGSADSVMIDATASLDPFVVLDARHGPVWIGPHAKIQAFTRLEGPCFIGRESQLFRANVREGCSIGPVCRVGGEIEESILHGFANKYHDGFLGHAYICPWVNLGANTINSDLKNDYSTVKVMLDGAMVDSGSTKVGCFVGDHTKTALASLFNTGSSIGVMSLVLPAGELLPKVIPAFTRIWHGLIEELPGGIETSIQSARIAMGRRNQTLTPAAEALLRATYESTAGDRGKSIARQQRNHSNPGRLS